MLVGAARERSFVWRCFIMVRGVEGLTQLTRNLAACRTRDAVRSSPTTRRAGWLECCTVSESYRNLRDAFHERANDNELCTVCLCCRPKQRT